MFELTPNPVAFAVAVLATGLAGLAAVAIRRKRGGRPTMFPLVVFSGWVLCWILAALLTGMSGLTLAATGLVFGFGTPLRNRVLRDQRRFDRAQTSATHVA